jgi:cytochrome b6-f complex iron-sulfur subunit
MPLVDDLNEPLSEEELSRRRFLLALGTGALTLAGLGTVATGAQYLRPNVLFEPATKFPVGSPEEIPVGGVLALPKRKLFVVREQAGCYALSAVCTHLGCVIQQGKDAGGRPGFLCPCHGSAFDLTGKVAGGPAPRPLDRLALSLERGRLVVDVSKKAASDAVVPL